MAYEWDEQKRQSNLRKHKLDFRKAHLAFTQDALVRVDERLEYDEVRYILYNLIGGQMVAIAFTYRGESVRIISMRRASKEEEIEYVKNRLGKGQTDDNG